MKAKAGILLVTFLALRIWSFGQGRVVVNEFMAWSGCNTSSEFIELLNFGPGPMNIGCYIVTNGQYAVTVPPNTIIKPGEYFVLSGQDILAKNCGNIDSAIKVDLNWNTCNCTDKPIPTTGDGFMQDGGNANEKIILLDPGLNLVDAVSRYATPSASQSITTSTRGGTCTSKTFDLDLMAIRYESIENSTGIDNSFARRVDGDCGWVKTTAISADAANKTGNTSSASYNFSTLSASECNGSTGSISISVSGTNVASLFPMTYTLAYDKDSTGTYNETDRYTYGSDSTASSIDISSLAYGQYRITVGSSLGCNLKSFDFFIFNCYGVVLPLKIVSFQYGGVTGGQHVFACEVENQDDLGSLVLEGGNGSNYSAVATIDQPALAKDNKFLFRVPFSTHSFFRLRAISKSGVVSYSQVLKIPSSPLPVGRIWSDPAQNRILFQYSADSRSKLHYAILNATGLIVGEGSMEAASGTQIISIPTRKLTRGIYLLSITGPSLAEPVTFRFAGE